MQSFSGNLRSKFPYSVQMQENTDHKILRIWTLFTQCKETKQRNQANLEKIKIDFDICFCVNFISKGDGEVSSTSNQLRGFPDISYFPEILCSQLFDNFNQKSSPTLLLTNRTYTRMLHCFIVSLFTHKQRQTEIGKKSCKCYKQNPEAELQLFENYSNTSPHYHPKITGYILKIRKITSLSLFMRLYD